MEIILKGKLHGCLKDLYEKMKVEPQDFSTQFSGRSEDDVLRPKFA